MAEANSKLPPIEQFGVYDPELNLIHVDNLVCETFRTCEAKYQLQIVQGLVPVEEAAALAFGKALHAGRAAYRMALKGQGPNTAYDVGIDGLSREWLASMPLEMQTETMIDDRRSLNNAIRLFGGYAENYLQLGEAVEVEIVNGAYLGTSPEHGMEVYYHWAIDELCLFDGQLYVREFKTTSYAPSPASFNQFKTSSAITGYIWGASQTRDIKGAIVDLLWVQAEPKTKYAKPLKDYYMIDPTIRRSLPQIELWKRNTLATVDAIVDAHHGGFYRFDFGDACVRFKKCPYYDIHSAEPDDWEKLIEEGYKVKTWNPYER